MGKIIRNGIVYAGSPNVEVIDAYTKTESDNRFASKSIYGDSSIKINSYNYSMVVGFLNTIPEIGYERVVIGTGNTVGNYASNYKIIGDTNTMYTNSNNNILIGNYIYETTLDDYDVVIGYSDKGMIVKENGNVISRGDVQCSDGSSGTISLRNLNPKQKTFTGTSDANGNLRIDTSGFSVKILLFAWNGQHVFIPFYYNSAWYVRCQRTDLNGSGIANSQFTINYYYI